MPPSCWSAAYGSPALADHVVARAGRWPARSSSPREPVSCRLSRASVAEVERREDGHDDDDKRRDPGDLPALDGHRRPSVSRVRGLPDSSFMRLSLLWSVFRLMPRISAARVLLPRVCSSVSRISRRSASSTVVPGVSVTVGQRLLAARDEQRRQVVRRDELAVAQDRRPLDHVAQLADVARPGILLEQLHRLLIDARGTDLLFTALNSFRNRWMSSGTSSRRSRSGGSSIANTFRR